MTIHYGPDFEIQRTRVEWREQFKAAKEIICVVGGVALFYLFIVLAMAL